MARTVNSKDLGTRTARRAIPIGSKIMLPLSHGRALGYRKGSKWGVWLARFDADGFRKEERKSGSVSLISWICERWAFQVWPLQSGPVSLAAFRPARLCPASSQPELYPKSITTVQDRDRKDDTCCNRRLWVSETAVLRLRSVCLS